MTKKQEHKQAIRAFLGTSIWTDEKLCALLAHAESKLRFVSCCCLIGVATADHALRGETTYWLNKHYCVAKQLPLASEAENAYLWLNGSIGSDEQDDANRRRVLRPIIRAELKRREHLRTLELESKQELVYAAI